MIMSYISSVSVMAPPDIFTIIQLFNHTMSALVTQSVSIRFNLNTFGFGIILDSGPL
ncbi:hypothetical protein NBG4_1080004 [Candidatus Sulfobium mesophilum]|uniref:Uncharacterized protein n=1 Tax=Candidatus Sulfobium mesophilum TaxID=2016548 RepID=A0A2U3QED7_9BACT|nr:hypothetical protein NBG4_1080004 [Candidatus Sulfobium mesophilum]